MRWTGTRSNPFASAFSQERTAMLRTRLLGLGFVGLLALTGISHGVGQDKDKEAYSDLYVPTPQNAVEKMLDMARVTKDDVVFDLGCGDGRIVATAAKKFGARGVGVDLNPVRIKEARATVRKFGVEKLVEIRLGNALHVKDLDRATVVCLYMLPEFMAKLEPIVKAKLKPGARIISHDFTFPHWKPDQAVEFVGIDDDGKKKELKLYLYTVKKKE
jgi:cyclopropane fatty-acyl-phospholipid synthase-like methyltransferase